MEMTMAEGSQRLFPDSMAGVIGLLHVLKDDVNRPGRRRPCTVPGDLEDRGHTKILQDLGHFTHKGCQPGGLDNVVHLGVSNKPMKLDELYQLIMIIPGIKPPCLSLHQRCHT
jgi:hypothetical protein